MFQHYIDVILFETWNLRRDTNQSINKDIYQTFLHVLAMLA